MEVRELRAQHHRDRPRRDRTRRHALAGPVRALADADRSPPSRSELAIWLFRFFAVQIVFYGMGLVFTGVLNSYRRFLAPAIAPIFNNLVVTVTLLGFYVPFRDSNPKLALTGLAVGTTLGVVTMAAVQIPSLLKLGGRYAAEDRLAPPGHCARSGAKMVPDAHLRRHQPHRCDVPNELRGRHGRRRPGGIAVRVAVLPAAVRDLRGGARNRDLPGACRARRTRAT